jgi:hypothetical protein
LVGCSAGSAFPTKRSRHASQSNTRRRSTAFPPAEARGPCQSSPTSTATCHAATAAAGHGGATPPLSR